MKLSQDFGVRALLATISLVCFELTIGACIWLVWYSYNATPEMILAILAIAQTPPMAAISFYFGTKMNK